jgi:hypothetical protein
MTMFPLELRIERADVSTSYELPDSGAVLSIGPPPRYRVTATVLDTIEKTIISYEFFSMEVPGKDPFEGIGHVTTTSWSKHLEHLRELRDALNELLEERDD